MQYNSLLYNINLCKYICGCIQDIPWITLGFEFGVFTYIEVYIVLGRVLDEMTSIKVYTGGRVLRFGLGLML